MKLYIDSSNNLKTIIKLDGREYVTEYESPRDQNVLGAIQDVLDAEKKDFVDLSEIEVFTGPGSFTGLRVGISIANALSFSLNIPINGQESGTTILPKYGKKPNISRPKDL